MTDAQSAPDDPRVRNIRRVAMTIVSIVIIWTCTATAVGVLRGVQAYQSQADASSQVTE